MSTVDPQLIDQIIAELKARGYIITAPAPAPPPPPPPPPPAPSVLVADNGTVKVTANVAKFAASVDSLIWNGKEFVDSHDHGRLFQTAMQVDGYGECNNPTEAGSVHDTTTSSSQLLAKQNQGADTIATEVMAAYWTPYPTGAAYCPRGAHPRVSGPVSDTRIIKRVKAGTVFKGVPYNDVLEWHVSVNSPGAQQSLGIEILTGYFPIEFSRVFEVQQTGLRELTNWKTLDDPNDGYPDAGTSMAQPSSPRNPMIFSNAAGTHAIGMIRAAGTIAACETPSYAAYKFDIGASSCTKLSVLTHSGVPCITNRPSFLVYVAVGTLATVHQRIFTLKQG